MTCRAKLLWAGLQATSAPLVFFFGSFALVPAVAGVETPACNIPAVGQSDRMIRAILDDVASAYKNDGGGGISEIRQMATNVFRISMLQEERIDRLTYHLAIDATCTVKILRKEESTTSFGPKRAIP